MATNEEMQNYENGMREAMGLETEEAFSHDNPEAPIQIVDNQGQTQEMDPAALAAEGMAYAGNYMASNGPVQATHVGKARQMTRAQLEEQKMNEKQGYPSCLEEADKTKELESRVVGIETGISQILSALNGQSSPEKQELKEFPGGSRAFLAVPPTPMSEAYGTVSPPSLPTTEPPVSSEPEPKPPKLPQVILSDGRKIAVPRPASPMSLGPATDAPQPPTELEVEVGREQAAAFQFSDSPPDLDADVALADQLEGPDGWDDPVSVIPEELVPAEPQTDSKLVKVAQLVQDVNTFMQSNDVHRFWRRHISNSLHRHVGYNGWPKALQQEFDEKFKGFLSDPQFISLCCRKIMSMEFGEVIGAKHVVSFVVATAGFTAFALSGLDG